MSLIFKGGLNIKNIDVEYATSMNLFRSTPHNILVRFTILNAHITIHFNTGHLKKKHRTIKSKNEYIPDLEIGTLSRTTDQQIKYDTVQYR